jgi:hypothetical protein
VEDLGRAARNACLGQIERLIQHLLKLQYLPAEASRRQWQLTVHDARRELHRQLTPTIRRHVEAKLPELGKVARRAAALELSDQDREKVSANLPASAGYTVDQFLDEKWLPAAVGIPT